MDRNTSDAKPRPDRVPVARSHAGVDRNMASPRMLRSRRTSPAHTRAWIETGYVIEGEGATAVVARSHAGVDRNRLSVARCWPANRSPAHTRAWIETVDNDVTAKVGTSRPLTRGRGSKLMARAHQNVAKSVARSHAGVDRNFDHISPEGLAQ